MFKSKRINPVVKKHFDPSFKKKHQEEHNLQALHGRDDDRSADTRGGRRVHGGAGRERGRVPSNERGRGCDKSADRFKSPHRCEVICFACDSADHRAGDLKCHKLVPKSRAAVQRRAEFSDGNKSGNLMRELLELRNEKKAHFRMLGDKVSAADRGETRGFGHEDNWEDEDEEDGFATAAVKSLKCLGVKCATTCACNAICFRPHVQAWLSWSERGTVNP